MRPRAIATVVAGIVALAMTATGHTAAPPKAGESFAGGRAVPLKAEGPAWYTLDYHRRVMAAGTDGVPLPPRADVPTGFGLAYPGIRPGQWLVTVTTNPVGFAWCSANFVFRKKGAYGLGTAGHCAAKDALGAYPDVTAYVVPPPGQGLPGFYHIGRFVLSRDNGVGEDFAMVQIYPAFAGWIDPTMPVWGGPIGTYSSTTPTAVQHFGHGMVVGTGGTPRAGAGLVFDARGGDAFAWYGAGAPGDSGSGVRVATGQAAGNFTHIVLYDGTRNSLVGEIYPGMLAGTTISKILQIASGWTLVNGSLLPISTGSGADGDDGDGGDEEPTSPGNGKGRGKKR